MPSSRVVFEAVMVVMFETGIVNVVEKNMGSALAHGQPCGRLEKARVRPSTAQVPECW